MTEELLKTEKGEANDIENLVVALNDLTIFVEAYHNPKIVVD